MEDSMLISWKYNLANLQLETHPRNKRIEEHLRNNNHTILLHPTISLIYISIANY